MIRLHIIVEGQTEETFVNQVLADHFGQYNISTDVRAVETGRNRNRIYRGGLRDYERVKRDLHRWMREDQNTDAYFITMFDLYALPENFPGYTASPCVTPYARVAALEAAFQVDIGDPRFVPYIQLHEFEALLLADPAKFDWEFIEHEAAIQRLVTMAAGFSSPELIDDNPTTAPSKRIIHVLPEYAGRKSSAGPLIAAKIGVSVLRAKCLHFNAWLEQIEAIGQKVIS